jgi:hypothetical protein
MRGVGVMSEVRNAYAILVGKPARQRLLGIRHRWEVQCWSLVNMVTNLWVP